MTKDKIPDNWEKMPVSTFYTGEYRKDHSRLNNNKVGYVIRPKDIFCQMKENGFLDSLSYYDFLRIIGKMAEKINKRMLSEDMFIFLAPYGLGAFYIVERVKQRKKLRFTRNEGGKGGVEFVYYRNAHSFNRAFTYKWNKKAVLSKNAELYRIIPSWNIRGNLHEEIMHRSVTKTIKEFETYRVRETPPIKPIKRSR
jgi:hypothetical protein